MAPLAVRVTAVPEHTVVALAVTPTVKVGAVKVTLEEGVLYGTTQPLLE